jgi:hypothetical protein
MRCPTLAFVAALAVLGTVHARAGTLDRTVAGDDVVVSLTSPFSELPPGGCVPYHINIRNEQNEAGTWEISVRATSNFSNIGGMVFKEDMTVPANVSAGLDVSIPLPVVPQNAGTMLIMTVSGPGFTGGRGQYLSTAYTNHTGATSPFTIVGSEVLGSTDTAGLETAFKDRHRQFYGSAVDAKKLPNDWRSYAGVATLILKDTEWLGLDAAQHDAICDYVAQGGHLSLYTSDDPAKRAPELRLPQPDGKPGYYGFGTISLQSAPFFPPDVDNLAGFIEKDHARLGPNVDADFTGWILRKALGTITVSGVLIFLFVTVFAVLIGPLNLFVFAKGKNRMRLFWTTPLISVLASLVLIVTILVTDGLGGSGRQFMACYSLPGMTREAVVQEQVARTAVLFSSHWSSDQDYLITPVSESALSQPTPAGHRMYTSIGTGESVETYQQQGNDFSGNWFRSRHVSAQYLQAVRPSRSTLTVLNAAAFGMQGATPVVLSSFPQELDRVFLLDQNLHYWTCDHLEPGQAMTCVPGTDGQFDSFWKEACADAGGKLRPMLSEARDRPGCFYATGVAPAIERLTTLNEIRWQNPRGVYLGPWVASNPPGANP